MALAASLGSCFPSVPKGGPKQATVLALVLDQSPSTVTAGRCQEVAARLRQYQALRGIKRLDVAVYGTGEGSEPSTLVTWTRWEVNHQLFEQPPFDDDVSADAARRRRDEADVELRLSRNADLDVGWERSQLAIAEFLDGFSELLERIESMVEFAKLCLESGQPAEEILPREGSAGDIYALEPKRLP